MTDLEPSDPFERVAFEASQGSRAAQDFPPSDFARVTPVPPDAPGPTFKHAKFGKPQHRPWAYRSRSGELLGYVVRFDLPTGGKEVLPYTLWRDAQGRLKWRWKSAHGVRALYGLDRLAARPAARVLVVEGEKTADAASGRFPDLVVVTWSGGANAVGKADWSDLRGREVLIWPDADDAGVKAAHQVRQEVVRIAAALVSVVQLPASLPPKWDLADEWPPGFGQQDAEAALSAALRNTVPVVEWPYGYRMESTGLWFDKPVDGKLVPVRLSDPFDVIGEARDPDGGDWSLVIRFRDRDGRQKTQVISKGDLASAAGEVRGRLASEGLFVTVQRGQADRFSAALAEVKARGRLTLVNATGWAGHDRFVLPNRTFGPPGCEQVHFTGSSTALHYQAAGNFKDWRREVAARASGNRLLLLALSISFSGPLLKLLSLEGGGFHFRGPSSCGKTTLALGAGSTWGGGGPLGAAHSWRATSNAIEMIAYGHSDTTLVLDELALVAPEEAGQAAYSLASGQAKARSRQDGSLRGRPEWRVMLLSTGEIGLADHIRTSRRGDRAMTGQELRLLDVAADGRAGMGVWEELHGFARPSELSDAVKQASQRHYGHAGPAFLEHLVRDRRNALETAKRLMTSFLREAQRPGDTGQVHRGAHRFALAAAAGTLAMEYGIVPWAENEAFDAALVLFERWAAGFGRQAVREEQSVLKLLRSALEMQQARFANLSSEVGPDGEPDESGRPAEARSLSTLGYKHNWQGQLFYLVHSAGWAEIFKGHDPSFAAQTVRDAGFLMLGEKNERLQRVKRIDGHPRRFYWVKASILEAEFLD